MTENNPKHIVEVVGNPSGKLANHLHFLEVLKLALQFFPLVIGKLFGDNIPRFIAKHAYPMDIILIIIRRLVYNSQNCHDILSLQKRNNQSSHDCGVALRSFFLILN